jgi:hypothetical protein
MQKILEKEAKKNKTKELIKTKGFQYVPKKDEIYQEKRNIIN